MPAQKPGVEHELNRVFLDVIDDDALRLDRVGRFFSTSMISFVPFSLSSRCGVWTRMS